MTKPIPRCTLDKAVSFLLLATTVSVCLGAIAAEPIFPVPARQDPSDTEAPTFDRVLFAQQPVTAPLGSGRVELAKGPTDGQPCLLVTSQQVGMQVEEPLFVTPSTQLSWTWKKEEGAVCVVQIQLRNAATGQTRYLGYAAGAWSEPLSADPTVEFTVNPEVPRQWTSVRRNLYEDMNKLLGWKSAQITEFYLSPWDGSPGWFRDIGLTNLTATDIESARIERELAGYARVGQGDYTPLQLKGYDQKHVALFETSFEECAPGRNSGANEWSAFGAEGNMDFNAMGRDMHVRYPAFDIVFRLSASIARSAICCAASPTRRWTTSALSRIRPAERSVGAKDTAT